MVLRLPPQPNSEFIQNFAAFVLTQSQFIRELDGGPNMSLWRCPINQEPDATGYWIGQGHTFHAFLVVREITLPNLAAREALRAWVDPDQRGKGLFSSLLKEACREAPLLSDREGMSVAAFQAWSNIKGFQCRYFDMENNCFVDEASIPTIERFDWFNDAKRWQLVLKLL